MDVCINQQANFRTGCDAVLMLNTLSLSENSKMCVAEEEQLISAKS